MKFKRGVWRQVYCPETRLVFEWSEIIHEQRQILMFCFVSKVNMTAAENFVKGLIALPSTPNYVKPSARGLNSPKTELRYNWSCLYIWAIKGIVRHKTASCSEPEAEYWFLTTADFSKSYCYKLRKMATQKIMTGIGNKLPLIKLKINGLHFII